MKRPENKRRETFKRREEEEEEEEEKKMMMMVRTTGMLGWRYSRTPIYAAIYLYQSSTVA